MECPVAHCHGQRGIEIVFRRNGRDAIHRVEQVVEKRLFNILNAQARAKTTAAGEFR
jgi:hypothetical protein